jgi:hypothetical protein
MKGPFKLSTSEDLDHYKATPHPQGSSYGLQASQISMRMIQCTKAA